VRSPRLKRRIQISNSEKICVRILAARCVRGLHQLHPLEKRGRRESRAPIAPAVVRTKNARVDHRFNRIIPAFPARMVYGLLRALLGERAFLPPSPCGLTMHPGPGWADTSPHDLTPASRRQDHTTSPSAPVSPKLSPDLVRSGEFRRRRLAAPFVRTPADRSRKDPPCNPLRARRCRVHRIPPRVRDDSRSAPCRVRRANC
jgi:hypothetical protein